MPGGYLCKGNFTLQTVAGTRELFHIREKTSAIGPDVLIVSNPVAEVDGHTSATARIPREKYAK